MSREIWKKVFGTIKDEDLVPLIELWSLQVKGFRQVTKDNIQTARPLVITEALKVKNLKLVKAFYNLSINIEKGEGDNETPDVEIRGEDIKNLIQHYDDGIELHQILGVLYSSSESVHHDRAIEFERQLLEKYEVPTLSELQLQQKKEDDHDASSETEVTNDINDLKIKWIKSEKKNQELRKTIDLLEKKYTDLKKHNKGEKQQWVKEKAQLQQDLGLEKSNKTELHKKLQIKLEDIDKHKEEVQKLKFEVSRLHALLMNANTGVGMKLPNNVQVTSPLKDKPLHIALVGDPKNRITEESKDPIFHVFNQEDLNEALEKGVFLDFDGIWIMSYLIAPQLKRKIKKQHTKNVMEFTDFPTMKLHIKKRGR